MADYEHRNISHVIVIFDDEEIRYYPNINGRFNKSPNFRRSEGKISKTWDEYIISWWSIRPPTNPQDFTKALDQAMLEQREEAIANFQEEAKIAQTIMLAQEEQESKVLNADELRKDPRFAGIMDNKAFYFPEPRESFGLEDLL